MCKLIECHKAKETSYFFVWPFKFFFFALFCCWIFFTWISWILSIAISTLLRLWFHYFLFNCWDLKGLEELSNIRKQHTCYSFFLVISRVFKLKNLRRTRKWSLEMKLPKNFYYFYYSYTLDSIVFDFLLPTNTSQHFLLSKHINICLHSLFVEKSFISRWPSNSTSFNWKISEGKIDHHHCSCQRKHARIPSSFSKCLSKWKYFSMLMNVILSKQS